MLIEDGLFSAVENYIARNGEDACSFVCMEDKELETIVDILHWYRIERPELQKEHDELLDFLYGDRRRMWWVDCENKPGYCRLEMDEDFYNKHKDKSTRMREIDNIIYEGNQEHLHKVIDIRDCLWT
jgi:hypothetical protein